MSSPNVVAVNESNFDSEVVNAQTPVLVDFWAEYCPPCKMIAPILDEIATEKAGSFKIAKINVEENQGLSSKFGIRAVPTLLFFKGGVVREQIVGRASKHDLIARLEALA
jgi:thioredoxin 1